MRRFSLVGTLLVIVTLVAGLSWLGINLIGRSFVAEGEQEHDLEGLSSDATITRDSYGIPYIDASSESDAWTALGYAHAQDRLWQMDILRRAGQGRLSEIFGRRTLSYDAFARTVGYRRAAEEILKKLPASTRKQLEAYSLGVNACIRDIDGRLPMEFDALAYEPEPWAPIHSVLISRLLAWELNTSFWTDLAYGDIRGRVDSTRFAEILPYYPSYAPTIIPGGQKPEPLLQGLSGTPDTTRPADSTLLISPVLERRLAGLMRTDRSMRQFLGMDGSALGSNAWVISGDRTTGGKPILANDPHLGHSAPSKWYQAVISWSGHRLAGVTLPGAPFVVIGRNERVAWGITSLMADETDFYIERLDSKKRTSVLHDGVWEKLKIIRDTIAVHDSASVPITIRISRHGPLISDVDPYVTRPRSTQDINTPTASPLLRDSAVAMRWTGSDVSLELAAWHAINTSRNLTEFTRGARLGGIPSLAFIYADVSGTIAFVPVARIPVRRPETGTTPMPGWESAYNWKGWYPAEKLPTLVNPKSGFILSANNRITNAPIIEISNLWQDPSRAVRLENLLTVGENISTTDFIQMQADLVSPFMLYMRDFLVRAFPDSARQGAAVREALARLVHWDGSMRDDSPEAAIMAQWLQRVIESTYRDEMGPLLFEHFATTGYMVTRTIRHHVMIESRWFDNTGTHGKTERRDDILRTALGASLQALNDYFGTWEMGRWRFGAFHTLTFNHPFTSNEKLRSIVDIGPFEIGGSGTTVNPGEWDYNMPYRVRSGASMRQIVDLADTNALLRSVITTGASGQPLNSYYKNQTVLWLSHGYVALRKTVPTGTEITSVTRLRGSPL